jgi:hypothetical protein
MDMTYAAGTEQPYKEMVIGIGPEGLGASLANQIDTAGHELLPRMHLLHTARRLLWAKNQLRVKG